MVIIMRSIPNSKATGPKHSRISEKVPSALATRSNHQPLTTLACMCYPSLLHLPTPATAVRPCSSLQPCTCPLNPAVLHVYKIGR
jgi:hypothetical protein